MGSDSMSFGPRQKMQESFALAQCNGNVAASESMESGQETLLLVLPLPMNDAF